MEDRRTRAFESGSVGTEPGRAAPVGALTCGPRRADLPQVVALSFPVPAPGLLPPPPPSRPR